MQTRMLPMIVPRMTAVRMTQITILERVLSEDGSPDRGADVMVVVVGASLSAALAAETAARNVDVMVLARWFVVAIVLVAVLVLKLVKCGSRTVARVEAERVAAVTAASGRSWGEDDEDDVNGEEREEEMAAMELFQMPISLLPLLLLSLLLLATTW